MRLTTKRGTRRIESALESFNAALDQLELGVGEVEDALLVNDAEFDAEMDRHHTRLRELEGKAAALIAAQQRGERVARRIRELLA